MRALSDIQPNPIYLSGGGNRTSVGHSKSRFVELHEMDLRLKPDNARKLDTCNRSEWDKDQQHMKEMAVKHTYIIPKCKDELHANTHQ